METTQLQAQFDQLFPAGPNQGEIHEVKAPGRVNLIGEHTDYNDGFVLPMAIDRATQLLFRSRKDAVVRLYSLVTKELTEFSLAGVVSKDGPAWSLYARGVAEALRAKGLLKTGIDAVVDSDVPMGGGLSSSASFEVAVGLALLTANKVELSKEELALAAQWAEHQYAGMPCGIMDQFISALGQKGHALLLDCRDRSTRQVALSDPNLRIVIANSNVKHQLVQGEYAARRNQCVTAVSHIKKKFAIHSLRDVTLEMLEDCRLGMDPTVYKRARHVIGEIQRTTQFAKAMEHRDYVACGQLMYASHDSLRDDYAVSCVELDTLVELARSVSGVYGARMTGGGFGGCIVTLTDASSVEALTRKLTTEYPKRHQKQASVFATVPSQGAHVLR